MCLVCNLQKYYKLNKHKQVMLLSTGGGGVRKPEPISNVFTFQIDKCRLNYTQVLFAFQALF